MHVKSRVLMFIYWSVYIFDILCPCLNMILSPCPHIINNQKNQGKKEKNKEKKRKENSKEKKNERYLLLMFKR